jgi:hypothetical protein
LHTQLSGKDRKVPGATAFIAFPTTLASAEYAFASGLGCQNPPYWIYKHKYDINERATFGSFHISQWIPLPLYRRTPATEKFANACVRR